MKKINITLLWLFTIGWLIGITIHSAWSADSFHQQVVEIVQRSIGNQQTTIIGRKGWFFFLPELQHLVAGPFWGENAKKVSNISNPDYADPLPAILDFKAQLDSVNIDLLLVPVPAKAAIYPEMLVTGTDMPIKRTELISLFSQHRQFYRLLRQKGVQVLDLTEVFLDHRSKYQVYCRQDTHWSSHACLLAAKEIGRTIGNPDWRKRAVNQTPYRLSTVQVEIVGDLGVSLSPASDKEVLTITVVSQDNGTTIKPWRKSPVLLLGDSHNLVFHAGGDMYVQGAGLADHLAHQLGFPVDLVAVRGSGATPARLSLFRRRDNLAGKRLVIWCFTVREFTEGQGWRKVPVIRPGR